MKSEDQSLIEFSLVDGGMLYRVWRSMHLAGHLFRRITGRIGVLLLLVWLPLLLLTRGEGALNLKIPFIEDIETQLRLLVALPLLIWAETFVHKNLRQIVKQFTLHKLISEKALPDFEASVHSALRLRNSIVIELILLILVYVVGMQFSSSPDKESWRSLSYAGQWFTWVSLPLFQFLLLRWYWRLFIWARFLWQVSNLDLNLVPTHPDRCCGLSFLSIGVISFAPVLMAQGTILAAMMANRIFFAGANLLDFKLEFFGIITFMIFVMLAPLMFFAPKLMIAKRNGEFAYGALAQDYVSEFDRKWLQNGREVTGESLLGHADIQSLADLANCFSVVEQMRAVPFGLRTVVQLTAFTLLPLLPLVLTVIPVGELAVRLLKIVL